MQLALQLLRDGKLVAIPTETVYGLAARSDAPASVDAIFRAKGRPSQRPLAVLVPDFEAAESLWLAGPWLEAARALGEAFWPGPLTLVCPAKAGLPEALYGGSPNLGVRCPDHPLALWLLRALGVPLAAPSANPSEAPSPTTAREVRGLLEGRIDAIVDGGPSRGGLESTIIALTHEGARVLRAGALSIAQLNAVLPPDWQLTAPHGSALRPTRFDATPALCDDGLELWCGDEVLRWSEATRDDLIRSLHGRLAELSPSFRCEARWRAGQALQADPRFAGVGQLMERYLSDKASRAR